jgi:hypothetical protein
MSRIKHYFVGISLASAATTESGVAILDSNLDVITLDKLFTMEDIKFFFENFISKQNAVFNITIPENPTMLNAKWKLYSRQYQLVQSNRLINKESDWIQRYSYRGCDYFKELKDKGIDVFRFDIHDLKSAFGLAGMYRDRTPVDCKAFQSALKFKFGIKNLPINMLPVAQLEAILGAYFSYAVNKKLKEYNVRYAYKGIDVIGLQQ